MFTCTGSEANDLALRIARYHTGGTGVIVTANAYHGVTAAVAEVSPSLGVPLGRHVRAVPRRRRTPPAWPRRSTTWSGTASGSPRSSPTRCSPPTACCPTRPGFLAPVADVVHAAGGLYIADEVQSGFGRTGGHMWGYQRHGLAPGHRDDGQADGQRPADRRDRRRGTTCWTDFGAHGAVLQHLRRQPGLRRRRGGRARRPRGGGLPANAAATGGYLKAELGRLAAGSPSWRTSAARACTSASTSSTRRPARPRPTSPRRSSTECATAAC